MLGNERLILVGGPGGVGKTTLAATLGVRLAEQGYKTLVLTVDPAQRLAQALGFEKFSSEIQRVQGADMKGELYATMLDTQRYFDRIIKKFAKSEAQKEKILNNPIYRTMVESLGGTHEYAAMERLYELASDPSYDRIVVDTPPMQNAVDLLKAPQRLAAFMDNSVLRWFQGGAPSISKRFFQTGTKLAMKLMRALFGDEFLTSFEQLMTDFEGLQYGFQERHKAVQKLLTDSNTAFLLVTYPSSERHRESISFRDELANQQIQLKGVFLNRVEPALPENVTIPENKEVAEWIEYHRRLHGLQKVWVEKFQSSFAGTPLRIIELSTEPLHCLPSLSRLGALLIS